MAKYKRGTAEGRRDNGAFYIAVPADRDDEPVREFASFTALRTAGIARIHRAAGQCAPCQERFWT
ncbi:protein of unknown function [Acidithiobacillus ferrivorans]|uniref:Uncharacterized protein n=1 Tax=Acidithiobacillus ferrivorans TaxID=160808 RepID=A0ABY1MMY3_9PROT|nr:protein of unknown function [Acidithiobacillus ferrivorans]